MRTVTIDDDRDTVDMMLRMLNRIAPEDEHIGFTAPEEVLRYAGHHAVDAVFLDIEMPGLDGITLAGKLQAAHPLINLIFATRHTEYMREAFAMYASGYLMKPVTEQSLTKALSHLRYRAPEPSDKPVRVQCFGNFEVYVKDTPVKFTRSKCKELFAYLIDRSGAVVTKDMVIGNLWPDHTADTAHKSMVRTALSEMIKTFRQLDINDLFLKYQNGISVNTALIDCDYFRYLAGDPYAIHRFRGEYMTQYEFAAETRLSLMKKS